MVLHSFGQDIRLFCPHFQTKRSCLEMREEQPTTATAFQARLETKAKSRVVTRARIERWFAVPEVRGSNPLGHTKKIDCIHAVYFFDTKGI